MKKIKKIKIDVLICAILMGICMAFFTGLILFGIVAAICYLYVGGVSVIILLRFIFPIIIIIGIISIKYWYRAFI